MFTIYLSEKKGQLKKLILATILYTNENLSFSYYRDRICKSTIMCWLVAINIR